MENSSSVSIWPLMLEVYGTINIMNGIDISWMRNTFHSKHFAHSCIGPQWCLVSSPSSKLTKLQQQERAFASYVKFAWIRAPFRDLVTFVAQLKSAQVPRFLSPIASFPNYDFGLESLLSLDWESIEEAYTTASQYLLQVLLDRYHVKMHLCALRQYLLLGQGDFVNHLMKLVE